VKDEGAEVGLKFRRRKAKKNVSGGWRRGGICEEKAEGCDGSWPRREGRGGKHADGSKDQRGKNGTAVSVASEHRTGEKIRDIKKQTI